MHAVESPKAGVELVRVLLEHGASLHQECSEYGFTCAVVPLCLAGGNPAKLALLLENGAEIQYKRTADYDALIDAVHDRDILRDPHLLDLLELLIAHGVALNRVSTYGESGFRALSCEGRFDAVRLLLDAGADETQLKWTLLIRSVALGSLADVEKAVGSGAFLEDRGHWSRTAWLLAVQTGDIAKARYLMECGADTAACGHCGDTSLFFAIANHHIPMLEWLLKIGTPVDQTDEFGTTVLMAAIEHGNAEALDILLTARNLWDDDWEVGVESLAVAFDKLSDLKEDLDSYWFRFEQIQRDIKASESEVVQTRLGTRGITATIITFFLGCALTYYITNQQPATLASPLPVPSPVKR